ncbi:uncharacterized protein LOC125657058 [Ostrea edulis]|uniref:uncharacterized protein LOC125657058 n=1 Tax=Ostrea edulis TaxID=37623 RepID=UPI0024AF4DCA|nr:uncharacterized protein LOC125657058 [Ostrea edulis]
MFHNHIVLMCYFVAIFSNKANSYGCSIGNITEDAPGCCVNFYRVNNFCQECRPGFIGYNCESACPYPWYGQLCIYRCQCPESECNHQYGCAPSTSPAYRGISTDTISWSSDEATLMSSTSTVKVKEKTAQERFESRTVHYFTSLASTVKVKEKTTQIVLCKDTSSELDNTIIITSGALISLVLILMIIWEICRYRTFLGLRPMNDVSYRIHEVNDIYIEINEVIVTEGFHEDNDITSSKECIEDGHTPLTEKGEDRSEDVYSTVCKEKTLFKKEVKDDGKQEHKRHI